MYGLWQPEGSLIWADKSVHRVIDAIADAVANGESVIAAGDLNTLNGYGENGNRAWAVRHAAVFKRFAEAGLVYCEPAAPNGRQAFPWPAELPEESLNVPTYRLGFCDPAYAMRQLDFVFVTPDLASRLTVRVLNGLAE
jgi:hypothetical protein